MDRQFDLSLCPEPFWLQEAFACMNYVHTLDSEEWLNQGGRWNRRQKEEFLLPYRSYRGAMRAKLRPVLEQYPLLAAYVDSAPRGQAGSKGCEPPIMRFLAQVQHIFEAEEMPSEAEIEAELNLAFQRMLENVPQDFPEERGIQDLPEEGIMQDSPEEEEMAIGGLRDVMAALEGWQGNDADKFKLLRLYSERREVMEQLWSFQEACKAIGRECLGLVQERFEACMEELKKPETIEAFMERVGIQVGEKYSGQITPMILPYNSCLIQFRALQENQGHYEMKLHIGIEVFRFYGFRGEGFYHNESLLHQLKALADPTRLKILHQLAERPCYPQEMAKDLGLTPATVLHHLGILMGAELIEMQVASGKKKIYYQVRKQGLQEAGQEILQLAMSKEERATQQKQQMQAEGGIQWI